MGDSKALRHNAQGVCLTKLREACQRSETQPVAAVLCSTESKLPCRLAHASRAGDLMGEVVGSFFARDILSALHTEPFLNLSVASLTAFVAAGSLPFPCKVAQAILHVVLGNKEDFNLPARAGG